MPLAVTAQQPQLLLPLPQLQRQQRCRISSCSLRVSGAG
jgi:hypothetical protein